MPNTEQNAQRALTRSSRRRPNTQGAASTKKAVQALLSPDETEGTILRMAAVLSSDATRSPAARDAHLAYVSGAIALAVALGVITDDRGLAVRRASLVIFEGATAPGAAYRADPAFAALVSAVRRKGGASTDSPLAMAELDRAAATAMLGRLMVAGIVGQPDATGFHPVIAGEC